ncbi:uncharacterized protein G2W53_007643 [Senna tora]|uniref:Uncharacterized protein n=1 Tax=Senna tora TaxID=362788 RepID=A0A835CF50_9FABA|nr:uncharacterized protein G2W53_007643 [Senna tora]
MTSHAIHAIKSAIRALNPLGFPNKMRSDRSDSIRQQHV